MKYYLPIVRKLVGRSLVVGLLAAGAVQMTGCNDAQKGTLIGGGLGAATGAIIGHQSGHSGGGALIGTAVGAGAGYIVGNESDKDKSRRHDPNYDY